ncbi:unnamed protein product [Sphagnum troendelagicum]|uniref:Uncharacterized protein n=1 Tax=Sphagnum troendelagicum TaxID=128251 RepID=A0ABP0V221_9BRYO
MYAGGVVEPKCPYQCTSEKYRMPNCYTMLEDLVYTLGGPWYEDAFNLFVEELNTLAAYQWWEGSVHSILTVLAYPIAWLWQDWRRRLKIQRLREYVCSEYDRGCLRSCRSRALYEGLKLAATPDLMLAYVDLFLGGDEKQPDLYHPG